MEICLSTLIWHDHPFEVAVREIVDLGVNKIELGYWHSPSESDSKKCDPKKYGDVNAVRTLLNKFNLEAPLATLYGDDRLDRLEFAAEVGCSLCIINGMGNNIDEIVRNLKPLLKRAEELKVKIAYENHVDSAVEGLNDMEKLSSKIESDSFGFIVAPHHLGALNKSTCECIRKLNERVFSCYLWDVRPGYDFRSNQGGDPDIPPWPFAGEGKQDFYKIVSALRKIGFNGYLDLMCEGMEKFSIEKMRPIVEKAYRYSLQCISNF
jgi:sugar phosphate isomerase/epimerase